MLYVGPKVVKQVGVPGDRIERPNVKGYRVFVQSTGSGARHLSAGSYLLYEVYLLHEENLYITGRLIITNRNLQRKNIILKKC